MKYLEVTAYHNTQIVSTADLKTHLRITFTDDDSYIAALEGAAVRMVEEYTNRFLLTTECTQYGNTFKDLNVLYKAPGISPGDWRVYYMSSGSWVGVNQNDIEEVSAISPPRIYADSTYTPATADDVFQAWKIDYKVGYSSAGDIPEALIQAIKIIVSDMYENRQSVIIGKTASEIPKTSTYLMNPYRVQTL